MFFNNLRSSIRHLRKNILYSTITIFGLGIALGAILLVTMFVKNEFSFDSFHQNRDQLYRLTTTYVNKDGLRQTVGTSGQIQGPSFKSAIPEISEYVRVFQVGFNVAGETKALQMDGMFADKDFFKVFSFPLLHGNPETAFADPNAMILTRQSALKFFGTTDVIGKILSVEHGSFTKDFMIKGIAEVIPMNSSISFEVLVPFSYLEESWKDTDWLNQYLTTFILLQKGIRPAQVEPKFPSVFQAEARDQIIAAKKAKGIAPDRQFGLQPIEDIHLNRTNLDEGGNSNGIESAGLTYSYILIGIGLFILVMACINFINLGIADSLKRLKEVGIRKIAGSSRWQIIRQFMLESSILCFVSFVIGLIVSILALPLFNSLVDKQLVIENIFNLQLLAIWAGLLIVCILLTGFYPAFVFSRFKPVIALSNKIRLSGGHWLGKGLVILQFCLAICLIIATVVYYSQMDFIRKKNLGYDPTDIVRVFVPTEKPAMLVDRVKNELLQSPAIKQIAIGSDNNGAILGGFPTRINGRDVRYVLSDADESLLPMLKIPLLVGRNFSNEFPGDKKNAAIVNESFVQAAGLADPLGKQFENTWGGTEPLTIIGVVKDFHYSWLKDKIQPQVIIMKSDLPFFWIKVNAGKRTEAVGLLSGILKKYASGAPYEFSFLEDDLRGSYRNDRHWQQVINYSAVLSIIICCIGLFGLAHLAAAQRIKEIGVRKVLGASVYSIVSLLSMDVIKLVSIGSLIAFPISWMVMNKWLEDFAYRIQLSWWMFVAAAALGIFIALLTISFQSIKAAKMDPVKSLRTE